MLFPVDTDIDSEFSDIVSYPWIEITERDYNNLPEYADVSIIFDRYYIIDFSTELKGYSFL